MDNTFLALKSLHILGAVAFLGNIIITGWWKVMADRTGDARIIAFAQRQVTLTDFVFTAGGAALILATGLGNTAIAHMDISRKRRAAPSFLDPHGGGSASRPWGRSEAPAGSPGAWGCSSPRG